MQGFATLRRLVLPSLTLAAALATPAWAAAPTTVQVGTLKAERHGDHGRPIILIPGLEGGPWVWERTIADLEKNHVVYAVTLAGFDGMPAPKDNAHLLDQASSALLALIDQQKLDHPVLVGHSLGGTLALRFAGEHGQRIAGVVAVDGLPILPGMDRMTPEQRKAAAEGIRAQMGNATPDEFQASTLSYMKTVGVIDPALAERYAALNARSDAKATAAYMAEDMAADYRPGLKQAQVPTLEISPYYAPDFSKPPMQFSEQQKADYYRQLLSDAPDAKVVSIAPARHFVMLDQPERFRQVLNDYLHTL